MESVRQLSNIFNPTHYKLSLTSRRTERTFHGTVTITGSLSKPDMIIPVHAKELSLTKVTIDGQDATSKAGQNDEVALQAPHQLAAGEHIIEIAFNGKITDAMHGLYPCHFTLDGQEEELLATQFESHYAREAFPCVDEPNAKATFDVTLSTEKDITVIGNMPVAAQHEEGDLLVTRFETTPVMSTYLLAWAAGKLSFKEATTKEGVLVRAYATPDQIDKVDFALDTAVKTLELYNTYFDTPYPLAKCDMVALPDFSSGAMENWGLITYRESAFFVDAASSSSTRERVAEVVAHELAHQWFGNLVTMRWWNDLWLNESFATWMATYARNELFPEWQMWTQFYNEEAAYALDRDALKSIQSVQQEVHHPDEIQTLFDPAIVYGKGACLVHMVHAYMGDKAFREGLRAYMKQHAYGNTVAADLWAAWSKASGKDIGAFMTPWISQPGHPLVKAEVAGSQAIITQTRFYSTPKDYADKDTTVWPVPLLAGVMASEELLETPQATITLASSEKPLLLNQARTGFYATLYSPAHLAKLAEEITAGRIEALDRLALLNEAYDLAKAGQQPTLEMLKLLEAYRGETSEPVWGAISGAIGALKLMVHDDEVLKPHLRQFAAELARSQYQRLGWSRIAGESYFDELLRPTILSLMGYSEDSAVVAKAQELLAAAKKPDDILGDIRAVVFSLNAKHGDEATFDRLLSWYQQEKSPEVKNQLTAGLCSAKQTSRLQRLIAMLKTKEVKAQDIFYWVAYLSRSHEGRPLMWRWIQQEWGWITDTFKSDGHYPFFVRYAASGFNDREGFAEFTRFFEPMLDNPMLTREIKQALENIEARVSWRERDLPAVQTYLKKIEVRS